jgi:O-antigen ligase
VPALPVADVSGGRGKLVQEGLRIALDNPVAGVGVGGFIRAYADRVGLAGRSPKSAASHTTVVTVAAEGGVIGLALLLWLAVAALALPFRNAGRTLQGRAALVLGLVLLAISVHSFGYNALFEDPTTWVALGLAACVTGAGTAAAGRGAGAGASGEPQQ